ncbi:MAG: hypothetical protein J6M30_09445 [Bacteroidales bacterium]|nr:hypothetical protein [Bacteroidales bacterium]MBP3254716.1 hypothetical protein [Bacteroidales bacterium]
MIKILSQKYFKNHFIPHFLKMPFAEKPPPFHILFLPIQKRVSKKAGFLHQKKWFFRSKNHFFPQLKRRSAKTKCESA